MAAAMAVFHGPQHTRRSIATADWRSMRSALSSNPEALSWEMSALKCGAMAAGSNRSIVRSAAKRAQWFSSFRRSTSAPMACVPFHCWPSGLSA